MATLEARRPTLGHPSAAPHSARNCGWGDRCYRHHDERGPAARLLQAEAHQAELAQAPSSVRRHAELGGAVVTAPLVETHLADLVANGGTVLVQLAGGWVHRVYGPSGSGTFTEVAI